MRKRHAIIGKKDKLFLWGFTRDGMVPRASQLVEKLSQDWSSTSMML